MNTAESPKMIGPFQVLRLIPNAGTIGEVFLCRRSTGQAKDKVPFIVKTFRPDLVEMRKEIEILEQPLHRNLIQYRQVGYDAEMERYYTVMDRLQVEPHSAQLMREAKLPFKTKVERFQALGDALRVLHEQYDEQGKPLYHGAIKPSNILVRKPKDEYHMVISDFGFLYRYVPEVYAADEKYAMSFVFMAPEMILHAKPDLWLKSGKPPRPCPASDVYSWALTMVYSLNGGRDGFYYVTSNTDHDDKHDVRVLNDVNVLYQKKLDVADRWTLKVGAKSGAEIHIERFTDFIFKCLAPDPRDRYDTMAEALDGFKSCIL